MARAVVNHVVCRTVVLRNQRTINMRMYTGPAAISLLQATRRFYSHPALYYLGFHKTSATCWRDSAGLQNKGFSTLV